ncbi:MAG: VOC family protein [Paracoccaceae bacterium]
MPALSTHLTVRGARAAIDFYVKAFGAEALFELIDPADGRIGHAELSIGGARLMISDEYPDFGALSPEALGGSPVKLHLYVEDAETVFARALALGATELRPVKEQFYGDRSGMLADPGGHHWFIATKGAEVSPAEMQARWNAAMAG